MQKTDEAKSRKLLVNRAQFFLEALDADATEFVFQTFSDNASTKVKRNVVVGSRGAPGDVDAKAIRRTQTEDPLARVIVSDFEDAFETLETLNDKGAGVFVTINEVEGGERKAEHVKRIRAVWADMDNGLPSIPWPLLPSMVVESSPGKFQAYWLCDGLTREQFSGVMARLAYDWKADPRACDVVRVLRVPGFSHRKGKAHQIGFVDSARLNALRKAGERPKRYSANEILEAFPPIVREARKALTTFKAGSTPVAVTRHALDYLLNQPSTTGELFVDDYDSWWKTGVALKREYGDAGFTLWDEWSKTSPKYSVHDVATKWEVLDRALEREGGVTLGSIFHHAKACGWERPKSDRAEENETTSGELTQTDVKRPEQSKQGTKRDAVLTMEWGSDAAKVIKPPRWLWPGYLMRGASFNMGGHSKVGKSQLTCLIAAHITTGKPWPGTTETRAPGTVVMLAAEDKPDVLIPRLACAGADISRVAMLYRTVEVDDKGSTIKGLVSLQDDIAKLDTMLTTMKGGKRGDPAMIVIDPISSYMGKADTNNSAEVRNALGQVVALAEKHDICVLIVMHRNKNTKDIADALDAFGGSQAFTAMARGNIIVGRDPEDPDSAVRVMKPHGMNLAADDTAAWKFQIKSDIWRSAEGVEFKSSKAEWTVRAPDVDPMEILKATAGKKKKLTETERVAMLVRDILRNGKPQPSADVIAQVMEQTSVTEKTIRRAALDVLHVTALRGKPKEPGAWVLSKSAAEGFDERVRSGKSLLVGAVHEQPEEAPL